MSLDKKVTEERFKVLFPEDPSSRVRGQFLGRQFIVVKRYNPKGKKSTYYVGDVRIKETDVEYQFIKNFQVPIPPKTKYARSLYNHR